MLYEIIRILVIPAGHGCFTNDSSGICDSNTSCVDSGNGTFMCLCQNGLQLINGTCDIGNFYLL